MSEQNQPSVDPRIAAFMDEMGWPDDGSQDAATCRQLAAEVLARCDEVDPARAKPDAATGTSQDYEGAAMSGDPGERARAERDHEIRAAGYAEGRNSLLAVLADPTSMPDPASEVLRSIRAFQDAEPATATDPSDYPVRLGLLGELAPAVPRAGRCPRCGHGRHSGACLNMASDNDCSCVGGEQRG